MELSINVEGKVITPKRTFVLEALSMPPSELKQHLQDIYLDVGHPKDVYMLNAEIDVTLSILVDLRKANRRKFKIGRAIRVLQKFQGLMRKKCAHVNLAWKYYVNNWDIETNEWTERMMDRAIDRDLFAIWTGSINPSLAKDWVLNPDHIKGFSAGPKAKPVDIIVNVVTGTTTAIGAYDYTVEAVRSNSNLRGE